MPVVKVNPLRFQAGREKEEGRMVEMQQSYSSGNWLVRAGSEEDFIERWTVLAEWLLNNVPGTESSVLLRNTGAPQRFLSLGVWENQEAWEGLAEIPEFAELNGRCRELCEEFEVHTYTLAASPSR